MKYLALSQKLNSSGSKLSYICSMKRKLFSIITILLFPLFAQTQNNTQIEKLLCIADSLRHFAPQKSITYANEALRISRQNKCNKCEIKSLIQIAKINHQTTHIESAIQHLTTAQDLASKYKLAFLQSDILLYSAKINSTLARFQTSRNQLYKALQIAESINDSTRISRTFNQIGLLNFDLENYDKALDYYFKALNISKKQDNLTTTARDLNNIAATYASKKIYNDFEKYIKQAIKINSKNGNQLWLGVNYYNLGVAQAEKKNYQIAFTNLDKAQEIFIEINQLEKLTKVYLEKAICFSELANNTNFEAFAIKAFNLAKDNHFLKQQYLSAIELHNFYAHSDITKAYKYLNYQHTLKDSLDLKANQTALKYFDANYKLDKQLLQNELKEQHRKYIVITLILALVLLIAALLWVITRLKLRNKLAKSEQLQLQTKLDSKKRELTSKLLSIGKKNEDLAEISSTIVKFINSTSNKKIQHQLQGVVTQIDKLIEKDFWIIFEKSFNQIHQDFNKKLGQQFPDLTPSELRLCAFLKLNMSTKEIAQLAGQKTESVEKARTRLRRKLGLTNSNTNLITFLAKI